MIVKRYKPLSQASIYHSLIHTTPLLQNLSIPTEDHFPAPPEVAAAPPPPPLTLSHPVLSKLEACPNLHQFSQIHAHAITSGLFHNVFAASRLLRFCTASLSPPDLHLTNLLFSQIQHPDVFCYNLVIKALSFTSYPLNSLSLYRQLLLQGLCPNEYTFCFLLDSCSHGMALWEGRQLHVHLNKHGLAAATFSATSLVHMYGDCGALPDALRAFEQMQLRSNASWGAMVDACIEHGKVFDGLKLFREMRSLGVDPSNATLVSILSGCAEQGDLVSGRAVHGHIAASGLELNVTLGTSLADMYSKNGAIETAMEVFSAMPVRTVASWNCLIHGMAINGHAAGAKCLFEEMLLEGDVCPNEVTFLAILIACSHAGLIEDGVEYFSLMSKAYGMVPNIKHYGCMVDLYGRAGRVEDAVEFIRIMPMKPDIGIWGALLGACRTHGHKELGELLAAQIMKIAPHDSCGYLLLSDAYASDRRWDDVVGVRKVMREMVIRKMPGFSSICSSQSRLYEPVGSQ
ncbi:pentatricopeptide repeat-containing protein At1g09190-like [Phoenix dactylifera]|uniref:Pentatricopeptide repeat-containing protein At1g09190-like n=1 Tax=Phoenix dactylifera TaxID=42345 RepID=A0A8B7C7I9_PHODC|nr:pentatricopeptide repeat-containing protein At1g09190-like [Phoenix dactylifera]